MSFRWQRCFKKDPGHPCRTYNGIHPDTGVEIVFPLRLDAAAIA
jgi:hypothetical protein